MTPSEKMAFAMEAAAMTTGTKDFTDSRSLTLKMARAALKAIHEPTPAMLDAGYTAYWFSSADPKSSICRAWRAMIAHALIEQEEGS